MYACLSCGEEIVSVKLSYCARCRPNKLYVKFENGFITRAYRESEMNFKTPRPVGVEYVEYELKGK